MDLEKLVKTDRVLFLPMNQEGPQHIEHLPELCGEISLLE